MINVREHSGPCGAQIGAQKMLRRCAEIRRESGNQLLPVPQKPKIVVVKLRQPPPIYESVPPANHFRFRLGPDSTIAIGSVVKRPGEERAGDEVELLVSHEESKEAPDAYEHLLRDAMRGEPFHFARQDYVEEAWRIVDPVLAADTPVLPYEPGTWGPAESDQLMFPGTWFNPRLAT